MKVISCDWLVVICYWLFVISIPIASELLVAEMRRRQCRVPTIHGRDTALPSPLDHSGVTGIDISCMGIVQISKQSKVNS